MFYLNNSLNTPTRYDIAKFIKFDGDVFNSLDAFFAANLYKLPSIGNYTIVAEAQRPDLLSYNLYGSTQYWWALMWYNNIIDITELSSGLTISYPSYSSIEDLYVLSSTYAKASRSS